MRNILVTNNPLVASSFGSVIDVRYLDCTYNEVLYFVRDLVHMGHTVLTHPLSGSVKPNETPFKSVLVSGTRGALDMDSLSVIEGSVATAEKFCVKFKSMSDDMKKDFMNIDFTLISSALSRLI